MTTRAVKGSTLTLSHLLRTEWAFFRVTFIFVQLAGSTLNIKRSTCHSNSAFCPPRRKLVTKATHLVEGDPLPKEWAKTEKARIRVGEDDPLSKERAKKPVRELASGVVQWRRTVLTRSQYRSNKQYQKHYYQLP